MRRLDAGSPMTQEDGIADWDDIEDEGVLDSSDTLDDDLVNDPLDTGVAPADRWSGADRFGTTAAEARQGEPLDRRLAAEVPDVDPYADAPQDEDDSTRRGYEQDVRAGRLVADDAGFGEDTEADAVAWDAGIDGGGASAEEAAIHVVDDPNGPGDEPVD